MLNALEEQAIRFLRGEDNPFDAIVVPDKPAHAFFDCHVSEVHDGQFEQICRVIEKYRRPDYRTRRQLHETRALVVRGNRGSGKTHLLHVLRQRETATPEIWVCPRYYDPAFPFTEYVLTELVRTLLSTEESDAAARLQWVARELARRLLGEAIAALDPPQWLEWSRPLHGRRPFVTRLKRRWADRESLLDDLTASSAPLAEICARHALSTTTAWAAVIRHVERTELGTGAAVRMRREVLLAFVELAFGNSTDRLASLLEHNFAQPEAVLPPSRADVVSLLLQTLTETLAAVGVPIIVALDNMERLLAQRGPVDDATATAFFSGLAHTIDQTRGVLLVLFVEQGLWSFVFTSAIDQFAQHRLLQGVRIRDYGCVWDLELAPPTPEQIEQVVRRRMAPVLARAPHGDRLPPCFPFSPLEIREIVTVKTDILRTALLRLRDRYDELVLPAGQQVQSAFEPEPARYPPGAADQPSPPQPADVLQRTWEDATAGGRRRLAMSRRAALAPELHTGLGRWLQELIGQQVRGWQLSAVRSAVTFGDHPAFGCVTLTTWQGPQGRAERVALGPLLGEGRSMPKDLEVKLSVLDQRPAIADELTVLLPFKQGPIAAQDLPAATRQVWETSAARRPISLCPLPSLDFAWLLGFPEWLAECAASDSAPESRSRFLLERTGYLLADLAPAGPSESDEPDEPEPNRLETSLSTGSPS